MSHIVPLIHKDWMVIRKYAWLFAIWLALFSFGNAVGILGYMVAGMMIIVISNTDLHPFHKYSMSLPIPRRDIVLSKYVSSLLFMLIGLLAGFLVQIAYIWLGGDGEGSVLYQNIVSGISLILFIAVYYPLYYWLGPKGGQTLKLVLVAVLFAITMAINTLWSDGLQTDYLWYGLGISCLVVFASYQLSAYIFSRTDV